MLLEKTADASQLILRTGLQLDFDFIKRGKGTRGRFRVTILRRIEGHLCKRFFLWFSAALDGQALSCHLGNQNRRERLAEGGGR